MILVVRILVGGDGGSLDVTTLWALRLLSAAIDLQLLFVAVRLVKDLGRTATGELSTLIFPPRGIQFVLPTDDFFR